MTAAKTREEPSWALLLGDVLALLFSFFVLLFAMSGIQDASFDDMRRSLARQLSGDPLAANAARRPEREQLADLLRPGMPLAYVAALLEERRTANSALAIARIAPTADGLQVTLPLSALSAQARPALRDLGALLGRLDNAMTVTVTMPAPDEALAAAQETASILAGAGRPARASAAPGSGPGRIDILLRQGRSPS